MEKKSEKKREHGVPVLEKDGDFHGWYSRQHLKLDAKGLWETYCAKPEDVPDPHADKAKYDEHIKRRKETRWKIEKTLSYELAKMVQEVEKPYDVLVRLRKMFVGATKLTLVHQLRSIMLMKYKKGSNLLTFIEDLKSGFTKLENMGLAIEDKLKPYILVMVLDDAFDDVLRPYLVQTLAGSEELKFDRVVELLESSYIENERRLQLSTQDQSQNKDKGETALPASDKRKSGKCHHCHMKGHWVAQCRIFKEKEKRGWKNPPPCRTRRDFHDDDRDPTRKGKQQQKEKRLRNDDDDDGGKPSKRSKTSGGDKYKHGKDKGMVVHSDIDESSESETALMAIDRRCFQTMTSEDEWILDSGATRHMTYNQKCLKNYKQVSAGVEVGGRHELHVMGVGDLTVKVKTEAGDKLLQLQGVYYVPSIQFNLFSIRQQLSVEKENRTAVHFDQVETASILCKGSIAHARLDPASRLYKLNLQRVAPREVSEICMSVVVRKRLEEIVRLWHNRLIHPGRNAFQSLAKDSAKAMGINNKCKAVEIADCEACITGKMTRRSFKRGKKDSKKERKEWAVGEKAHTDIWGPYHVASYSGCRYFCVFVDDASRFLTLFVLRERSEIYKVFEEYRKRVETQLNVKMKSLQLDGAKEYIKLKKRCEEELGMECTLTIKKTPEQNGVAERMNRTVGEKIRCCLHHGHLDQELWAEAAITSAYVLNLLPAKWNGMVAPFKVWFKRDAPLWHLRVFGCEAWVYIDADERKKCDKRAQKMMFVGYPTDRRGYKLIDCETLKPKYSHTVIFDEHKFPKLATPEEAHKNRQLRAQQKKQAEAAKKGGKRVGVPVLEENVARNHEAVAHLYDYVLPQEDSEEMRVVQRAVSGQSGSTEDSGTLHLEMSERRAQEVEEPRLINAGERTGPQHSVPEDESAREHRSGGAAAQESRELRESHATEASDRSDGREMNTKAGNQEVSGMEAVSGRKRTRGESNDTAVSEAAKRPRTGEETTSVAPAPTAEPAQQVKPSSWTQVQTTRSGRQTKPPRWMSEHVLMARELESASEMARKGFIKSVARKWHAEAYVMAASVTVSDEPATLKEAMASPEYLQWKGAADAEYDSLIANGTWELVPRTQGMKILEKYGMSKCNPTSVPFNPGLVLSKALCATEEEEIKIMQDKPYRQAVGSLMYLMLGTRPDIAFAVRECTQFFANPGIAHWKAVKHILRYLRGTTDYGLVLGGVKFVKKPLQHCMFAFCDADFASHEDRRSIAGYVTKLGESLVSWCSQAEKTVALHTTEAEYIALSMLVQEVIHIRMMVEELLRSRPAATTIYIDNASALKLAKNPEFHGRSKHIDIKHHFVREKEEANEIDIKKVASADNVADVFTKPLVRATFEKHRDALRVFPVQLHLREDSGGALGD